MSELFFDELAIPQPAYHLGIQGGDHAEQTGKMMIAIEKVLRDEKPRLVVVFGDTNSTLSGALAAAKLKIPVLHVEAGLRSFNRNMPEEINRIVADHISDLLFAPTQTAMDNLTRENLAGIAHITGDIMLDTLKENLEKAVHHSTILTDLQLIEKSYCVLTLHRPYNVDQMGTLKPLIKSLMGGTETIVFPVHPRTRKLIKQMDLKTSGSIRFVDPLGYFDFLVLQKNAKKIITDSGGIQKEAYMLQVPCITIRTETEWTETVRDGWNILTGFNEKKLAEAIASFIPIAKQNTLFGTYPVGKKMTDIIRKYL